ncbi:uncharacterized protein J3D65DRAFT_444663 [Phyllosticta citribraziliensis]|uniref:Uncharacterized protein n=1 Tax=Phyllosticta citribraziliensis TaxID=989973 RepID=A0ABR1LN83_9PEZI
MRRCVVGKDCLLAILSLTGATPRIPTPSLSHVSSRQPTRSAQPRCSASPAPATWPPDGACRVAHVRLLAPADAAPTATATPTPTPTCDRQQNGWKDWSGGLCWLLVPSAQPQASTRMPGEPFWFTLPSSMLCTDGQPDGRTDRPWAHGMAGQGRAGLFLAWRSLQCQRVSESVWHAPADARRDLTAWLAGWLAGWLAAWLYFFPFPSAVRAQSGGQGRAGQGRAGQGKTCHPAGWPGCQKCQPSQPRAARALLDGRKGSRRWGVAVCFHASHHGAAEA